jgi:hypothetical protein
LGKVTGLHKAVFIAMMAVGLFLIFYGNSFGTSCHCAEGAICLCPDNTLMYEIAGVMLMLAGIGIWIFHKYRKVEVID